MESQWHNVVTVCGNSLSFLTWRIFLTTCLLQSYWFEFGIRSTQQNPVTDSYKDFHKICLNTGAVVLGWLVLTQGCSDFFSDYMWQDFVKWTCCQTCFTLNFLFEWLELVVMIILVNCNECHLLKIV